MINYYTNLPSQPSSNSDDVTLQAFDSYASLPLEISVSVYDAMKGFFEERGFDPVSAEAITVTIVRQSKSNDYNPMGILDNLKGLDSVQLSSVTAEILNYSRFKTSFLGYALDFSPNEEVKRNILP